MKPKSRVSFCFGPGFPAFEGVEGMKFRAQTLLRVTAMVLSTVSLATVVACNTVKGAGEDIQETSDNTKKALSGSK